MRLAHALWGLKRTFAALITGCALCCCAVPHTALTVAVHWVQNVPLWRACDLLGGLLLAVKSLLDLPQRRGGMQMHTRFPHCVKGAL